MKNTGYPIKRILLIETTPHNGVKINISMLERTMSVTLLKYLYTTALLTNYNLSDWYSLTNLRAFLGVNISEAITEFLLSV